MPTTRTAYKYHFKKGNKIVQTGVTGNIFLLESELQQKFDGGHIKQVGFRTTPDEAFAWKEEQRRQGKPVSSYRRFPPRTIHDLASEWEAKQIEQIKKAKPVISL